MQIGKLDQLVELQSITTGNNSGEITRTHVSQGSVWAEVLSQRGSEAFETARTFARETIRVKIRYRADVETDWRLIWMAQNYEITAVDRSNRRDGVLWLTAQVVDAR